MDLTEGGASAGRTMVTAILGDLRLTAIVDSRPEAAIGETVHIELPPDPSCWFDGQGERIR